MENFDTSNSLVRAYLIDFVAQAPACILTAVDWSQPILAYEYYVFGNFTERVGFRYWDDYSTLSVLTPPRITDWEEFLRGVGESAAVRFLTSRDKMNSQAIRRAPTCLMPFTGVIMFDRQGMIPKDAVENGSRCESLKRMIAALRKLQPVHHTADNSYSDLPDAVWDFESQLRAGTTT